MQAPLRHDGLAEGTKWVLGQTAPHHAILNTAIHHRENAIFRKTPSGDEAGRRNPERKVMAGANCSDELVTLVVF